VLENRSELRWPADVYIEGGDQFRGWFNSSLIVGLVAHDRAPYKSVLTHGWTVDAQGKAMHKSAGNAVPPEEVIKESGAETLRLWCASSNYFDDMRCSNEILQRVTDGYRKLRNTARFALGNLHGFDPGRDTVPEAGLLEIDRWALAELDRVITKVRQAYEDYEFHTVYHTLYNFATVTLSARYFDIIKDRLYTFAPRNEARRSGQTALYRIVDSLARMLAPILAFTAEEIWESMPRQEAASVTSIHTETFPVATEAKENELLSVWERLFDVRDEVLVALETARTAKQIGSSLEARVELRANGDTYELLSAYRDSLRYLFIVSQVDVVNADSANRTVVKIHSADGEKCERCWNYSVRVGESLRYPTICERCLVALEEIETAVSAQG
jgi:isoleucyl-tRNA synthetase